jgi:hypothetical protein
MNRRTFDRYAVNVMHFPLEHLVNVKKPAKLMLTRPKRAGASPFHPTIAGPAFPGRLIEGGTMDGQRFDSVTKSLAAGVDRRRVIKGLGGSVLGVLSLGLARRAVDAAPQTCVTCVCGVGNPCNPRSTTCTEVRGFPAEQTCAEACERRNQNLCSAGNAFHCPRGCPA